MYYQDLTFYNCASIFTFEEVLNVGWLDKEHPFKQGSTSKEHLDKLIKIFDGNSVFDSSVNKYRCGDYCNLCGIYEPPVYSDQFKSNIGLGSSEIWFPALEENIYYASPDMIIHYIRDHKYSPPKEFWNAVMEVDLNKKFIGKEIKQEIIDKYRKGKTFF